MSWVYLDDQFPDHPKVVRAGEAAAYLFVCGLAYCKRHGTDGAIGKSAALRLVGAKAKALASRLVEVGLWEDLGDTFHVHNYTDWNRPSASRSEAGRKAARARWDKEPTSYANASESHSDRIEIADASTCTIPIPIPIPIPNSSPHGFDKPVDESVEEKNLVLVLEAFADMQGKRSKVIHSPQWRNVVIANARAEHGDRIRGWLDKFDLPADRLAAGLIDGPHPTWSQHRKVVA